LEQFKYICNELQDKNEMDIMKKYRHNVACYTAKIIRKTETIDFYRLL